MIPGFAAAEEEELLAQAHIFVLPSLFEGQPLSLLQAMASGRCCVTSDGCGQRDLITDGRNGLLFRPGHVTACVDALRRCVSDAEVRVALGRAAQASVTGRTWERAAGQALDLITRVATS